MHERICQAGTYEHFDLGDFGKDDDPWTQLMNNTREHGGGAKQSEIKRKRQRKANIGVKKKEWNKKQIKVYSKEKNTVKLVN